MRCITEEQWIALIYYAKRQFVYDLLLGNLQNVKAIWERMESIHISVMPKVAVSLRLDNYYALTYDKSERWKHQFREEIWTYLEGLLPNSVLGVPFADNLIALLISLKTNTHAENRVELLDLITPWAKELSDQFGVKVVFGLGSVYNDPRLLHFSFQESVRVLDSLEFAGMDVRFSVLPCTQGNKELMSSSITTKEQEVDSFPCWPEWANSRIVRKLKLGDSPGVIAELRVSFEEKMDKFKGNDRNKFAPVISLELALAVIRQVFPQEFSYTAYSEIAEYVCTPEKDEPGKWLEKFGENLIHLAKSNGLSHNPNIARVKAYVEDHLDEELSLSHIAEIVHLAPSYLSQLFKKQTGEGLNDFVAERRINKACRLLLTTSLPVSDVARKVGFQDVNYFIRVFKHRQRLTPLEFRKGAKQN